MITAKEEATSSPWILRDLKLRVQNPQIHLVEWKSNIGRKNFNFEDCELPLTP